MASSGSFDPQVQQIATVYARGFLQAAERESGPAELTSLSETLEGVVDLLVAKNPKLADRLSSTRMSSADKTVLLRKLLGGRVPGTVVRFLGVVCQHGRFEYIQAIAAQVRRLANEKAGLVPVTVTSAVALPEEVVTRVVQSLETALGKRIELTQAVNAELLGGLQVRVGDTVFDGSVQNRLERVRRTAIERTAERIRADINRFVAVQ